MSTLAELSTEYFETVEKLKSWLKAYQAETPHSIDKQRTVCVVQSMIREARLTAAYLEHYYDGNRAGTVFGADARIKCGRKNWAENS